jgi:hypothetical protein
LVLGLLVLSLLLLSILTCRITGLPVAEEGRHMPMEASRDVLDWSTRLAGPYI